MTADVEDFLNDELRQAKLILGREPSPREMYAQMLKLGPTERAQKINELDRRLEYAHLGVESAGRVHAYRRAMSRANEDARRVGR
jgi:hypothetical protein